MAEAGNGNAPSGNGDEDKANDKKTSKPTRGRPPKPSKIIKGVNRRSTADLFEEDGEISADDDTKQSPDDDPRKTTTRSNSRSRAGNDAASMPPPLTKPAPTLSDMMGYLERQEARMIERFRAQATNTTQAVEQLGGEITAGITSLETKIAALKTKVAEIDVVKKTVSKLKTDVSAQHQELESKVVTTKLLAAENHRLYYELKDIVKRNSNKIEDQDARSDAQEQGRRNYSLFLAGLEQERMSLGGLKNFMHSEMELEVGSVNIGNVTPVERRSDRNKVLRIDFPTMSDRMVFYRARSNLRGKGEYWVREDLTDRRGRLAFLCRQRVRNNSIHRTWTYMGDVYAMALVDSEPTKIEKESDIPGRGGPPSTQLLPPPVNTVNLAVPASTRPSSASGSDTIQDDGEIPSTSGEPQPTDGSAPTKRS